MHAQTDQRFEPSWQGLQYTKERELVRAQTPGARHILEMLTKPVSQEQKLAGSYQTNKMQTSPMQHLEYRK